MQYSREDIERKREEAAQRKRQKELSQQPQKSSPASTPINNGYSNQNRTPNFGNGAKRHFGNSFQKHNSSPAYSNWNSNSSSSFKSKSSIKQQSSSNRFSPMAASHNFYGTKEMCEVTCFLISDSRFAVDQSIYNQKLIELFKTVPTRLYDAKTKIWNFHINDYSLILEKLATMKPDITFTGLPNFVLKASKTLLQEEQMKKCIDLSSIDASLMTSLYTFQRQGIEYGISKNGRCLIADDMGLGKTRQALGIAQYFRKDWPLLIITPSSVRYQWSEAIIDSLSSVPAQCIQHVMSTKDYLDKSEVTIVSYDLLSRRADEFAARKFGVVICDESHYLKSAKTQRTKAVQRLASNAQRIILLSGTPALSRPIELHSQIKLIMPSFMGYKEYGIRYCAGAQTNYGWDFTGSSNLKELEIILKACGIIRRLKSDVMSELPSKIRQKIILDPHLIKASTKEMKAASQNLENVKSGTSKHSALLQYYSETSKAKEKAVCNYITDLLENQRKFLVFAHHQSMMDAISDVLTAKKIQFIRIDGKTNPEQRKFFVDTFQKEERVLVAVLSITAANAGITMTAATLVIFAELYWNPGILCQAEDRVHRIGQSDNVVIRYLLAKETADDHLWPQIQKKIDILNEVGLDQNLNLDQADIENQPSHHVESKIDDYFSPSSHHNQPKLDDYFSSSEPSTSLSELDASNKADSQNKSGDIKELLNEDDDAFDSIDLEDFV
ncbi:hypothetical protein QAD02_016760 [Eretmocerus hayati]|uniref:Uncharacterized protein n=1 Tax=Eretmocerus hayati TaxID=131215 RepID=A0ACC2PD16_9HYME|nr:hypothetical protein QAD02_016760 [Eretmocerus hayati]